MGVTIPSPRSFCVCLLDFLAISVCLSLRVYMAVVYVSPRSQNCPPASVGLLVLQNIFSNFSYEILLVSYSISDGFSMSKFSMVFHMLGSRWFLRYIRIPRM